MNNKIKIINSIKLYIGVSCLLLLSLVGAKDSPPKAWLGISFLDIPSEKLPQTYRKTNFIAAIQINQVFTGSSAEQSGLQSGDLILSINGQKLTSRKTLLDSIGSKGVGDIVTIEYGRNNKVITQKIALSPRPQDLKAITNLLIGSPAPKLQGSYYSNDMKKLKDLKGKAILLDFWATWCGPCIQSLPIIEQIHHNYKDKGLVVIGVSSEALPLLKKFQEENNLTYSFFNDVSGLTTSSFNAYAYPTLVYIDKSGLIQRIEPGYHPYKDIESKVKEILP